MELKIILLLILVHFFGDFVLQTNDMAMNKSKSQKWLLIHTAVYSLLFVVFGLVYAVVNFVVHFVVDYFSSRAGAHFKQQDNQKGFFMVLGTDQAIHLSTLMITYPLLGEFGWFLP
jgi:NADH:ubiquinone oxidoreductase subunit B-like Fe-S oxidoreductase